MSPGEMPEQKGVLTDFDLSGFGTSDTEERSPPFLKILSEQPQQLNSYILSRRPVRRMLQPARRVLQLS